LPKLQARKGFPVLLTHRVASVVNSATRTVRCNMLPCETRTWATAVRFLYKTTWRSIPGRPRHSSTQL